MTTALSKAASEHAPNHGPTLALAGGVCNLRSRRFPLKIGRSDKPLWFSEGLSPQQTPQRPSPQRNPFSRPLPSLMAAAPTRITVAGGALYTLGEARPKGIGQKPRRRRWIGQHAVPPPRFPEGRPRGCGGAEERRSLLLLLGACGSGITNA